MPKHYRLHGFHIRVLSDRPTLKERLHRSLRYKDAEAIPTPSAVDATLDFRMDREATSLPDNARHVGTTEHCGISIWTASDRMILHRENATVDLRPEAGVAEAAIASDLLASNSDGRRSPLFHLIALSLAILLRYHDWFPLHSAGLAQSERGVLLAARSGSGKSTAALSLVRNGWDYLSDDTVLLRSEGGCIKAYSFRRNFCVDPDAAIQFPELDEPAWPPSLSDSAKWQVDLDQLYPEQSVAICTPRLVVLPDIVDASESRVEPADAKSVLGELINQGAFFLTPDSEVASRHLAVLRQLIDQSHTYHLRAGRDVLDEPRTLHTLLAPLLKDVPESGTP